MVDDEFSLPGDPLPLVAEEEPRTKPGTVGSLAHVELWEDATGARGFTLATPDGGLCSGSAAELVATLRGFGLVPATEDPPPPVESAAPVTRAAATRLRGGFWPGQ